MKIKVKNRSDSFVGFGIPEMHLRREFSPNETKELESEEIEKLAYQPGGQELLDKYFMIMDKNFAEQISPDVAAEPEYSFTEEQIKNLLINDSLDKFLDFLDFAPSGAIDIAKNLAVAYATDTNKINALYKKTGFNVLKAQQLVKEAEVEKKQETRARRVSTETKTEAAEPQKPTYRRV